LVSEMAVIAFSQPGVVRDVGTTLQAVPS